MSTWQDIIGLLEMYTSGGIVIMTGLDCQVVETAVPADMAVYTGKTYPQKGIRTTIQFDSDYVTTLSPEVLARPEIWQCHMAQVAERLSVLEKLRLAAQQSWLLFLLAPLTWLVNNALQVDSLETAVSLLLPTITSTLIVLLRKQILRLLRMTIWPLIMKLVYRYVQRRFDAFLEG